MNNILKITNGFELNQLIYLFDGYTAIVSDTQCHIGTDQGIILLDLSFTIDNVVFTNINEFVIALEIQ